MDDDTNIFDPLDPSEAWLEKITVGGFRRWHIIASVLGILMSISKIYDHKEIKDLINLFIFSDNGLLLHTFSHTTNQTGNRSGLSTQTDYQKVS